VTRVFEAFTGKDVTPEKFYAIVDTKLNLCKQSSLVITTLVADALLVRTAGKPCPDPLSQRPFPLAVIQNLRCLGQEVVVYGHPCRILWR
jgi:hypothetical protein